MDSFAHSGCSLQRAKRRDCNSKLAEQPAEWHSRSETMPKNGTLRKKKRLKARRGMDRATGVADEGSNGTRPPRTALARGPTFADAPIPRGAAGTKRPADDDARAAAARGAAPAEAREAPRRGAAATRLRRGRGRGGGPAGRAGARVDRRRAFKKDFGRRHRHRGHGARRRSRSAARVERGRGLRGLRVEEDGEVGGTAIDRATARDPYGFVVGSGDVIRGLSEGVKGMRPGGRRVITVPWQCARGAKGRPPKVPPPRVACASTSSCSRWARGS